MSFEFLPPTQRDRPYTVSEINSGITSMIESGTTVLWVEGEVSNFKQASSGHCYFTLKDGSSQIPAVMWRSIAQRQKFEPESGMAIAAIVTLRVYHKGGYYQLDVQRMQPAGLGALYAALEKLKRKLEQEGLFDPARKRPVPETVRRLGVITSKRGAAIRDILKVVSSRAPQTDLIIVDVPVQGQKAAGAIVRAIRDMNSHGKVDCIIVGRGGGSIEDLWAFNEEAVARAVSESETPVISAVGHEIDFTIIDFVADVRAPTPSAAAELAVPDTRETARLYETLADRLAYGFSTYWDQVRASYDRCAESAAIRKPARMLAEALQNQDLLRDRQMRAIGTRLEKSRMRVSSAASQLHALSPLGVLSRGYSVVSLPEGKPVKDSAQLSPGAEVTMRFSKGEAKGKVTEVDR